MKVCILGPTHPYRGGIVHFNKRLVDAFQKKAINLCVLSWKRLYPSFLLPKARKDFQDNTSQTQITVKKEEKILDYLNPISWLKTYFKIRKGRNSIFITHWQQAIHFPVYAFLFILLRVFSRTQIVLIAHNVNSHESSWIVKILSRIIFKLAHKIVTHSKFEAKSASEFVDSKKIITSFHPIYDIFPYEECNISEVRKELGVKNKVLLFFGFIRPYKGLEYLIEAVNLIKDEIPDLSLIIAGELFWKSKERSTFLSNIKRAPFKILKRLMLGKEKLEDYNPLLLIEKYKLKDRVVVYNEYIPNEEVYKFFCVSDALVTPYTSATQSGPIQIAYNFNKPVISSRISGLEEVVGEKSSGLLFKAGDIQALGNTIKDFYKFDIDWKYEVSKYKTKFSWESYLSNIMVKIE